MSKGNAGVTYFFAGYLEQAVRSGASPLASWTNTKNAMSGIKVEFEVRLTASGTKRSAIGRSEIIDSSGIVVLLPLELKAGDAVKLEIADSLIHGQIFQVQPQSSSFETAIQVRQVNLGGTEIARILQRILLDVLPDVPGLDSLEPKLD